MDLNKKWKRNFIFSRRENVLGGPSYIFINRIWSAYMEKVQWNGLLIELRPDIGMLRTNVNLNNWYDVRETHLVEKCITLQNKNKVIVAWNWEYECKTFRPTSILSDKSVLFQFRNVRQQQRTVCRIYFLGIFWEMS